MSMTSRSSQSTSLRTLDANEYAIVGAVDFETDEVGLTPWRIERGMMPLLDNLLVKKAAEPVGVRVAVESDTASLEVDVDPGSDVSRLMPSAQWSFDLLVDGKFYARQTLPKQAQRLRFDGWDSGTHRFELYLCHNSPVRIKGVWVNKEASATPPTDGRPRWLVHGSSITHCSSLPAPMDPWPSIVANEMGLNHTNLGYSGNCKLEPTIARLLARQPADLISLCLGINVYGGEYSYRTFRANVIGMIQTIRDRHPDTPMVCVSPIFSPPRETAEGQTGMTLVGMRQQMAELVDVFQTRGDSNLHYLSGLDIFGPEQNEHLPDELHPNVEGNRVLAQRYIEKVMPLLGVTRTSGNV